MEGIDTIGALRSLLNKLTVRLEYWSDPVSTVTITTTPTTIAGAPINIILPSNCTPIFVFRTLRIGRLINTSGSDNTV